ncbi:hypothetical protein Nepgr_006349 [Nepenthes gracilis]|uniref:Uncharacterized protein n=1 Tax=Nepenthes gracilis TaxID=150966 RepID=A0AAD3S581_NEPGR|nr:hypothetical protein Nepgr_006349 [Nepenthes gracilis]
MPTIFHTVPVRFFVRHRISKQEPHLPAVQPPPPLSHRALSTRSVFSGGVWLTPPPLLENILRLRIYSSEI